MTWPEGAKALVRRNRQNQYIIFVSIPRSKPAESSGPPDGLEYYYDHIAIFTTENKDKAQTIAELLTKDYEGGPGEDYPEGFLFKSEAEMSLKERVRAHDQLSNLEDWALQMHEKATRYAEKVCMLVLGDTERNETSTTAANEEGDHRFENPQNLPLPDDQQEIWDLLENHIFTAKQLAKRVLAAPISEEAIRKRIQAIRGSKRKIENKRSVGYYRPDAPPAGNKDIKA